MTNSEWLEKMKKDKIDQDYFKYRKVKALEIIAEELIKHNETAGWVVTVLENIETTLNRR